MVQYSRLHNRIQSQFLKICLLVFFFNSMCPQFRLVRSQQYSTTSNGSSNQSGYAGENGGME